MSKIQVGNIYITKTAEKQLKKLPKEIQERFKKQIKIFRENPYYPSLHFKQFKVVLSEHSEIESIIHLYISNNLKSKSQICMK